MTTEDKYPLCWPVGYKRTSYRKHSGFKQTMDKAQRFLHSEVNRLGGSNLIVSTNIPLRNDGMMYSVYMNRKIDDPGVAIYFKYKKKDISMCCDQYVSVWENIYALGKGIEALRGMERWGVSDFLDRAFTGFTALPENTQKKKWFEVLGVQPDASYAGIRAAFNALAKQYHPDIPGTGDAQKFKDIKDAYEQSSK